jgi:hypothetical protein
MDNITSRAREPNPQHLLPSPRDVSAAAAHRMRLGASIARQLERGALATNDAESLAVADMLAAAAKPENIYTAEDLHDAHGELFSGYGSFNLVGSRLSPAYAKAASARARKRATIALNRYTPKSGEQLRFITLTLPRMIASFEKTFEVLELALVLLKRRRYFRETVSGAVIGTEFTLGDPRCDKHLLHRTPIRSEAVKRCEACRAFVWSPSDGWHCHAHLACWSKWVDWIELGEQWTQCVEVAAHRLSVNFKIETSHGRAIVDIRLVTDEQGGKGTITNRECVLELVKYCIKSSAFNKIPAAELCAVEKVLYRRRMIETYGVCNANRGSGSVEEKASVEATNALAYLDTLHTTGACEPSTTGACEPSTTGACEPSTTGACEPSTTDGSTRPQTAHTGKRKRKPKGESLRKVGERMIKAGHRVEWQELLAYVFAERREYRKKQLVDRYPAARFITLSGETFGAGVASEADNVEIQSLSAAAQVECEWLN